MAVPKVAIYIRPTMKDGKRPYLKPVLTGNGKPKEGYAKGHPERFDAYDYYLRYVRAGKRVYQRIGSDASQSQMAKRNLEVSLEAASRGIKLADDQDVILPKSQGRRLFAASDDYLEEIKATKKPATLHSYRKSQAYFMESCGKVYLEEVTREDLLAFRVYLRDKQGLSQRSVYNRFLNIVVFLRHQGITGLVKKGDWPDYEEGIPEIYEQEERDAFFSACTPAQLVLFHFFLMTGMREQEVMHTFWSDVNFSQGTITVSAKPQYGWTAKAYKSREIPVPQSLIAMLASIKPENAKGLLFPNLAGNPHEEFLKQCKAIAERAGLDPEEFYLHRWRATFATMHLRAGVDIRTVQLWMGHSDLESTIRYLKPAQGAAVQAKVNATFAGVKHAA